MALPEILTNMIETVSRERKKHPTGELIPYNRQQIYDAITFSLDQDLAFKLRGWLEIVTAEKVLPIWSHLWVNKETLEFFWKNWLDKQMPERLLNLAKEILTKVVNINVEREQLDNAWRDLSEEPGLEGFSYKYLDASNARQAAVQALTWALGDTDGCPKFSFETTDEDLLDPECGDAAFWAVGAYGGEIGTIREPNWTRRQEFWDWWLTEAIPQAWELCLQA